MGFVLHLMTYNIYAFSAAGELVSNINFWNGEHTWTGWDGTEYRNVDTNYNFMTADWNISPTLDPFSALSLSKMASMMSWMKLEVIVVIQFLRQTPLLLLLMD